MKIDLLNDPEIPAGRDLIEHMVAAHMVATDEEELLHMVGISIAELSAAGPDHALKVLMHAVYRGQALIVSLLNVATEQEAGGRGMDDLTEQRLDIWTQVRQTT